MTDTMEVVDLCLDSDTEREEQKSPEESSDAIDLCDSSDDDEERHQGTTTTTTTTALRSGSCSHNKSRRVSTTPMTATTVAARRSDNLGFMNVADSDLDDSDEELLFYSATRTPGHSSSNRVSLEASHSTEAKKHHRLESNSSQDSDEEIMVVTRSGSQEISDDIFVIEEATAYPANTVSPHVKPKTITPKKTDEASFDTTRSSRKRSASREASNESTKLDVNPYARKRNRCESIQPVVETFQRISSADQRLSTFHYPMLLENSVQHEDSRAKLAVSFWKLARRCTCQSRHRPKLQHFVNNIVKVALSRSHAVRSLDEWLQMGKVNSTNGSNGTSAVKSAKVELQNDLQSVGFDSLSTPITSSTSGRKYYTIAEATLVVLLEHVENIQRNQNEAMGDAQFWVSLETLIPKIDRLLLPICPGKLTRPNETDNGASHYLASSTRSSEFLQIAKLETNLKFGNSTAPFIKRHRFQKRCHFELLPKGHEVARFVRSRTFPEPIGYYRTSSITRHGEVPLKYRGVCLAVDNREGGGGSKSLHGMCNRLEMQQVPFFVGALKIGDYAFFANCNQRLAGQQTIVPGGVSDRMNYLCPIIIERKSVQDVAGSIHDGRWKRQKHRMYHGQMVFGYDKCRMVYIIEGKVESQTVSGGYLASRHYNVTKERFDKEINNLKEEGFDVLLTPSRENTMFELARWAAKVAKDLQAGTLEVKYTYAEFTAAIAKIDKAVDFSRIAKDHYAMKMSRLKPPPQVEANASTKRSKALQRKPNEDSKDSGESASKSRFHKLKTAALKLACSEAGLPKSGKREDLMARLEGPRPPALWLKRKKQGQYVPERHNVAGSALLVALYLHERDNGPGGLCKDDLYAKAEGLCITKNPFSGGTTQTGPYLYTGWSSMKKLLTGDPPLVILKQRMYSLTRSCDTAGLSLAKAVHTWNHQHGNCTCGNPK